MNSLLAAALLACGSVSGPPSGPEPGSPAREMVRSKHLVYGIGEEYKGFWETAFAQVTTGSATEIEELFHDYLVNMNDMGEPQARLAAERPSLEAGTWRVFPDGRMETTYRLRQNAYWHDGVSLSADDVVFGFEVQVNPQLSTVPRSATQAIESVRAVDSHTVLVIWKRTYAFADRLQRGELNPLPRHLLAETYGSSLEQFLNLPYWTTGFVGLGPFQFSRWTQSVQLDLEAFDRYWAGRPQLDTITVRFIFDPNTMVANLLAGEIHAAGAGTYAQALVLKEELERAGKGTVIFHSNANWRFLGPYALDPQRHYLRDPRFRAALYHAVDKRDLVEAEYPGSGVIADAWVAPTDPQWNVVQDAIRVFDYSPERALRLFAEAGWRRPDASGPGSDGLTGPSGEKAQMDLHGLGSISPFIVDFWQRVGLPTQLVATPPQLARDPQWLSTRGGVEITARTIDPEMMKSRFHSSAIPLPERRYVGANRQGYATPVVDELIDRYAVALRQEERWQIEREVIRHVLGDAAIGPIFFTQGNMAVAAGVAGIRPMRVGGGRFTVSWNARDWDRTPG